MQSNSATSKRRGGGSRVSLFLLLGAAIGAAAALFVTPLSGADLRRLITKRPKREGRVVPASERPPEVSSAISSTVSDKTSAKISLGRDPLIAERDLQKREVRAASRPEMRISEQRYRIAHSGRRPSNIL
ncbi:MAG: YtxH domain-containing protein [Acidobacteria bacterium]|nr:YtxH domain-containing protein [Acidobacteriota bacterium]